jgi:hypothetical protein
MQLRNERYSVTDSASFPYLKALTTRGSLSVATTPMDTNLKTLEVSNCQGNSPLYVLLSNDATTQTYLEQVKARVFKEIMYLMSMILSNSYVHTACRDLHNRLHCPLSNTCSFLHLRH